MNHRYQPTRDPHDGLWWQIALGIFVGQLMTAIVAGIGFFLLAGAATYETEQQTKRLTQQMQRIVAPTTPTYSTPTRQVRTTRPLEPDERCIRNKRYKRLPNGWADMPYDPC